MTTGTVVVAPLSFLILVNFSSLSFEKFVSLARGLSILLIFSKNLFWFHWFFYIIFLFSVSFISALIFISSVLLALSLFWSSFSRWEFTLIWTTLSCITGATNFPLSTALAVSHILICLYFHCRLVHFVFNYSWDFLFDTWFRSVLFNF